ncbi:MAG TPA: hypothetical protein VMI32_01255 [Candidatus Solibacter sp.]|nr:hypothetical protein [Candidatus Solibacter sp.]
MTTKVFSEWLIGLALHERARFLIRVGSQLTIYAREYSISGSNSENDALNHKRLLGINELQHKLLGQAGLYLDGEHDKIYPDHVFSEIVFQTAEHYGITSDLTTAIRYAQQKTQKPGAEAVEQNPQSTTDIS